MAKVIILGTASAVPDETHENTYLAILGQERLVLVDCPGNPLLRLRQAGLDPHALTDLVLTHFHPDHVSGLPLLLLDLWLLGRRRELHLYGLPHTLDRAEAMMVLYDWATWQDFYPVEFHRLPEVEMTLVTEDESLRVFASPVRHSLPALGLRVESKLNGKFLAYSCDTEPCSQVARLAQGAAVLLHEATGSFPGHTSASQAGVLAREAGAESLCLIHYSERGVAAQQLVRAAQEAYRGKVCLAEDFMLFEI